MSGGGQNAAWIAVDWGTTHLRAWAMAESGTVLAEAASDDGMGGLTRSEFGPALARLTTGWPTDVPVIACGMVGSRQGWAEAPYNAVPCPPLAETLARVPDAPRVRIVPGLKQTAPPDVMRGEETQIAGFLALNPGWDGVACLPGTHAKWVQISAGEVVSFRTFLTGELFGLLSDQSILRHSLTEDWDGAAFDQAVADGLSRPERLAGEFFTLRAGPLLDLTHAAAGRARLSGLLIGAELAAARPYWLGQQVAVIGEGALSRIYGTALEAQGVPVTLADGAAMVRAGLTAAWRHEKERI